VVFKANAEQIEKAKELIKKMKFTFNSESFENPSLQKYWRNIEALALDRDAPEEVEDFTCKSSVDLTVK
jgi:ATP-dependent DNA helicase 2 subunit 1